jgi:hypothetical protein
MKARGPLTRDESQLVKTTPVESSAMASSPSSPTGGAGEEDAWDSQMTGRLSQAPIMSCSNFSNA